MMYDFGNSCQTNDEEVEQLALQLYEGTEQPDTNLTEIFNHPNGELFVRLSNVNGVLDIKRVIGVGNEIYLQELDAEELEQGRYLLCGKVRQPDCL